MRSMRLGRRGLISVLSVAGVILLLLFVVVPMVGRGMLRDKLQALISEQMNATLEMGGLAYLPPYGARVTDARLTAKDAAGREVELFSAKSIVLKLAELPIGSGPLVIKALTIDTPSVRLVHEQGGMVGRGAPITEIATTQPTEASKQKLSEIFELRQITMTDGSFVYEDRAVPESVPLAWGGLTLDVKTEPKTAAEYAFSFDATNGEVGKFTAKGTFNIDDLLLRLEQSRIEATVDASATDSPLPGDVQRVLKLYEISGAVSVDSSGEVPLMRPMEGRLTSVIELKNAKGKIPGASAPLDNVSLKITCSAEPGKKAAGDAEGSSPQDGAQLPLMRAQLERLDARGAGATLAASATLNGDATMLRVEQLKIHAMLDSKAKTSILPSDVLVPLQAYALGGEAIVELTGEAPIDDPQRGTLTSSTIELKNATGWLPNAGAPLKSVNLKLHCNARQAATPAMLAGYAVPLLRANLEHLDIVGPGATVSAGVMLQTDEHGVRVQDCRLDATVDPTVEQNALPAEIIAKLYEYAASGTASIQLSGEAPFDDFTQARGTTTIALDKVTGQVPGAGAPFHAVSLKMQCDVAPAANPTLIAGVAVPHVKVNIEQLEVQGAGASVSGAMKFTTDDSTVTVEQCQLEAQIDPSAEGNALPPAVLELLAEYAASGKASLTLTGDAPLTEPARANVVATIALSDARGQLPGATAPIEGVNVKATVTAAASTQPASETQVLPKLLKVSIDHLRASGAGTSLDVSGDVVLNGENRACGVTDLKIAANLSDDLSILPASLVKALAQFKLMGKVDCTINGSGPLPETREALDLAQADVVISNERLRVHLPDYPEPIHNIAEITGHLADGVLSLKTIRAYYGEDFVFVREAEVPLDSLPDRLDIRRFDGAVTFSNNVPKYPADIADIFALARPRDRFDFEGSADLDLTDAAVPDHRYQVRIQSTDRSAISALGGRVPMLNLVTDIMLTPEAIQLNRFEANIMNGKAVVVGRLILVDDMSYTGEIRLRQIDLNTAAGLLAKPGEDPLVVSGDLSADIKFAGAGIDESALNNLRTVDHAILEISRGDLYKIPVLRQIVERIKLSNAATVGDTEANISIADGVITIHEAVVAAPALGVKGRGTITFEQELNIAGVANPLGSWTKRANIGLITATEDLITKGSSILYNVEVRGTIEKPDVRVTGGEKIINTDKKKSAK